MSCISASVFQHKQYEHIFMAFNNKPRTLTTVRSEELIQLDDSDDEESIVAESPLPGEIQKSTSNSVSIIFLNNYNIN